MGCWMLDGKTCVGLTSLPGDEVDGRTVILILMGPDSCDGEPRELST